MRARTAAGGRPIGGVWRRAYAAGLALLTLLGLGLASAPSAHAATLTVNTSAHSDSTAGPCSLAQAIANVSAGERAWPNCVEVGTYGSNDTIAFAIPPAECPADVCTISAPFVYEIGRPVTIDGYTQGAATPDGARPNTLAVGSNAVLKIHLTKAATAGFIDGLLIRSSNVTIRGLAITGFGGGARGALVLDGTFGAVSNVTIAGNFIGFNPAGTVAANGNGILSRSVATNNIIGGTTPEARNVISGNSTGIRIEGTGNRIVGNYVGTDPSGTAARPNATGVSARSGVIVGGTAPTERNVISGNSSVGVESEGGATIQGNYIGTNAAGTGALPNNVGVYTFEKSVTVGGTVVGAGNVTSGNTWGVFLRGDFQGDASGTVVQGNRIGTDAGGSGALGNVQAGVYVDGQRVTVGGTTAEAANVIAFTTGGPGVGVNGLGAVLGNRIHSNAGLGIDNQAFDDPASGVTPNDPGDVDFGPNGLLNFPVLTTAVVGPTSTTVAGTFDSRPDRQFRIELFANQECDRSNHGEGQTFLGAVDAATDASGAARFVASLPAVPAGRSPRPRLGFSRAS